MSTRLYVYANSGKPVLAEYLEIDGRVIRDPSGNPYKVPADFDWNTYMGKFEKLKHSLEAMEKAERSLPDEGIPAIRDAAVVYGFLYAQFHAAWPASPSDIQRTYNGYTAKVHCAVDFVPAFTPAASFLYGAACAASGLSGRGEFGWQEKIKHLVMGLTGTEFGDLSETLTYQENYFNNPCTTLTLYQERLEYVHKRCRSL